MQDMQELWRYRQRRGRQHDGRPRESRWVLITSKSSIGPDLSAAEGWCGCCPKGVSIRVTAIEPGAVDSELKFSTTGGARDHVLSFYEQAIPAEAVARAIAFAIEQPTDVDVNEIVIRPTAQSF